MKTHTATITKTLLNGFALMVLVVSLTTGVLGHAAQISNTAVVESNTTDPNLANNSATVVDELCYKSDVSLISTSPTTSLAGNNLEFTVEVTNNGPWNCFNIWFWCSNGLQQHYHRFDSSFWSINQCNIDRISSTNICRCNFT